MPFYPPPHGGLPPPHAHDDSFARECGDFARDRPEAYRAFEQMAVRRPISGGAEVGLADKMCEDKHVPDFTSCLQCFLFQSYGDARLTGQPWRLRRLDLSRNGLADSSICLVVDRLMYVDLRLDRLLLGGNAMRIAGLQKVTEYAWNCQDPLAELDVADNEICSALGDADEAGREAVSGLLRCFYNHPGYPQTSSATGVVVITPLILRLAGNGVKKPEKLLREIEDCGGRDRVRFCSGPESYRRTTDEYLSVHLPNLTGPPKLKLSAEAKERAKRDERREAREQAKEAPGRRRHRASADDRATAGKQGSRSRRAVASPRRAHAAPGRHRDRARGGRGRPEASSPEHWRPGSPGDESEASEPAKPAAPPTRPRPSTPAAQQLYGTWTPPSVMNDRDQQSLQKEVGDMLSRLEVSTENEASTKDMFAEFVVCMVVAKKGPEEIETELASFLGERARSLVVWLSERLRQWAAHGHAGMRPSARPATLLADACQ